MKKQLLGLVALVACLTLAACGGSGQAESQPAAEEKQPTAAQVVEAVSAELTFVDNMTTVDGDLFFDFYLLDPETVEDACMYTSGSRATAEEVTVIKMKEGEDISLAQEAADQRVEDQRLAYENYIPEELTKIDGAVTYTHGQYLLLVVADDPSPASEAFEAQF